MDFRHHVKCTVHVVLGVAIIGIVYQHLPVCGQATENNKMPAAGKQPRSLGGDHRLPF